MSASLGSVPYAPPDVTLNPDVLVAYHGTTTRTNTGQQDVYETTVPRVSIMTGIPIGN